MWCWYPSGGVPANSSSHPSDIRLTLNSSGRNRRFQNSTTRSGPSAFRNILTLSSSSVAQYRIPAITVISHDRHDETNNRQCYSFLNNLLRLASKKHLSSIWLALLMVTYRCPVNSPHKRPVIWKTFPYHGGLRYTHLTYTDSMYQYSPHDECRFAMKSREFPYNRYAQCKFEYLAIKQKCYMQSDSKYKFSSSMQEVVAQIIVQSHKSHNALVLYPIMQHLVPKWAHFVLNGVLCDIERVHCEILWLVHRFAWLRWLQKFISITFSRFFHYYQ